MTNMQLIIIDMRNKYVKLFVWHFIKNEFINLIPHQNKNNRFQKFFKSIVIDCKSLKDIFE